MKKMMKRIAVITAVIVVILGSYAAYVLTAYYRLPDNLTLEVKRNGANHYFEDKELYKAGEYYWAMTYNIGFGAYRKDFSFFMDGGKYSQAKDEDSVVASVCGIGDIINAVNPDFLFLQEVDVDGTRSHHVNQVDLLNQFILGYYYTFAQNYDSPYLFFPPWEPHGANVSGLLTYSKPQITDAMRRSLPISQSLGKLVDLDRCYSVSRVPLDNGKQLCLYNVHLSAYVSDESLKDAQLAMLYRDMEGDYQKGNYVVCGGDFNRNLKKEDSDSASANQVQLFSREDLPEGFTLAIDEAKEEKIKHNTCRDGGKPYEEDTSDTVTLDGFIVSENINVNYYYHMDWGYEFSDHEPVIMQFQIIE